MRRNRSLLRLDWLALVLTVSACSLYAVMSAVRGLWMEALICGTTAVMTAVIGQVLWREDTANAGIRAMGAQRMHAPAMAFWRVEVSDKQWGLRHTTTGVFLPLEEGDLLCLVATVGGADTEEEH